MFLTADEIRELTGKVRPSAQFRELIRQGYKPDRRLDGRPVLARDVVLKRQGSQRLPRVFKPDFTGLD